MRIPPNYSIFLLLTLLLGLLALSESTKCPGCKAKLPFNCPTTLNRNGFPKGFMFGAASSAYQVEGAEGRGVNVWDSYTHRWPFRTQDRTTGDIAINSFKYYKDDVAALKNMGADAYRFSIAWSRVLPRGKVNKGVSEIGVAYYNDLINELKKNGIEPFVTLYHWDLPQYLEDEYGGLLNRQFIYDFVDYSELCFQRFGDRVKNWITINQPYSIAFKGYDEGTYPPGRCSPWRQPRCDEGGDSSVEPYIVTHNEILAHAHVAKLYREKYKPFQHGQIGLTMISRWFYPLNETSQEDLDAVERAMAFFFGWFMDPFFKGDYPQIMKDRSGSRLLTFTPEEIKMVNGSLDFLGLNYYITQYVTSTTMDPSYANDVGVKYSYVRDGVSLGVDGYGGFTYYPPGFTKVLELIKNEYNNPPIYITENGLKTNGKLSEKESINDPERIEFHCSHLSCLKCSIESGSNVKGYFVWSLADNYEFGDGFGVRFGLNYVDFKNATERKPKKSAEWFSQFLNADKKKSNNILLPSSSTN